MQFATPPKITLIHCPSFIRSWSYVWCLNCLLCEICKPPEAGWGMQYHGLVTLGCSLSLVRHLVGDWGSHTLFLVSGSVFSWFMAVATWMMELKTLYKYVSTKSNNWFHAQKMKRKFYYQKTFETKEKRNLLLLLFVELYNLLKSKQPFSV